MTVRPLGRAEARAAADLAARAFFDDPLFRFVYPDPARRRGGFAREHEAYIRHVYRPVGLAEVAEVDGALAGVALWLPPGARSTWWRELLTMPTLARAVGLRRLPLALRAYRAFDASWPDGRFGYLGLLAVAPEAQGRGVGRALVQSGLARADTERAATYLETGTRRNVAFYERLGFRVTGRIALPAGGPAHWAMWRDPAT